MRTRSVLILTAVASIGSNAAADSSPLQIDFGRALAGTAWVQDEAAGQQGADLDKQARNARVPRRYAEKNSLRWYVHGGGAFDVEGLDTHFALVGGGISYYIVDDLAFLLELNTLYFDQPGPDAFGVGFGLLFRWHFLSRDTWSMYIEGGAGMIGLTERVPVPDQQEPAGGTKFNFTPQFGGGFSWQIMDNTRLLTGARWYHISNARTQDNNPGLDSILLYVGATVAF